MLCCCIFAGVVFVVPFKHLLMTLSSHRIHFWLWVILWYGVINALELLPCRWWCCFRVIDANQRLIVASFCLLTSKKVAVHGECCCVGVDECRRLIAILYQSLIDTSFSIQGDWC